MKNVAQKCNFQQTPQSNHSPIGPKFTQSGHPAANVNFKILLKVNKSFYRQVSTAQMIWRLVLGKRWTKVL
jgi:2-keto-4-pentenoate hydratase/2-oxohepta-3-ene-1,7-dioic acid hydratase in catechol pathway